MPDRFRPGRALWPEVRNSRPGSVTHAEWSAIRGRATSVAVFAAAAARTLAYGWPERVGSLVAWGTLLGVFVALSAFGFLHYRSEGVRPRRVLVVEDDAPTRAMLRAEFGRAGGWEVEEVGTAGGAIERLDNRLAPLLDWVILDLMLPDRSGVSVLFHARLLRPGPRVVISTARLRGSPEWDQVIALGADFVLEKTEEGRERLRGLMEARP